LNKYVNTLKLMIKNVNNNLMLNKQQKAQSGLCRLITDTLVQIKLNNSYISEY
jgi:hypothetical protein